MTFGGRDKEAQTMAAPTLSQSKYLLGRTQAEHGRLNRQGRLISKLTEHFLGDVGLAPGMRVLDIGSGTGDVAMLAARLVGPSGQVVCIDADAAALSVAKDRAGAEAFSNVLFHKCDFRQYQTSTKCDAIVGRCVLLHQSDPLAALDSILQHLLPGGLVAFQEPWFSRAFSYPEAPLFQEMLGWLHETVRASGLDSDIGLRLPSLYMSAGLPAPKLSFEMLVECSAESEVYDFCVDTVRSLLPRIEELGITSAETVQVDTLAQRLRTEASTLDSVIGVMPLIGACSTKP
jgi:SAM-dependent methyltransferase